jgi:hypothetical protein
MHTRELVAGETDGSQQLSNDVNNAVSIIKRLTTEVEDPRTGEKSVRMPKVMVKASQVRPAAGCQLLRGSYLER